MAISYDANLLVLTGIAEVKLNDHWDSRFPVRLVDAEKIGILNGGKLRP